jgi:exodeoxyribonuclease V alpha subunit
MFTNNDVHQQFAGYFAEPDLKPYAYLLSRKLSEGHICLDLRRPIEEFDNMPDYCRGLPTGDGPLRSLPLVARNGDDNQPFVLHDNRLYIQRYFRYETSFLRNIMGLLVAEERVLAERLGLIDTHAALIGRLLSPSPAGPVVPTEPGDLTEVLPDAGVVASVDLVDWQLAAVITGILNNFTLITGGPGTGKTTTVAKILAVLYTLDPSLRVALAAPTGKAAARMAESLRNTKIPLETAITAKFQALAPSTLHRLLKPIMGTPYFRYNGDNPLPFDVVIADECSMIDIAMFAKLLDAIGPDTRLILLGDKDQLASVEAGSLFGDICQAQPHLNYFSAQRVQLINSFIADPRRRIPDDRISDDDPHPIFQHMVELRQSHRFSAANDIGKFSRALLAGGLGELIQIGATPDGQVLIDPAYSGEYFERFIAGYAAFIGERDIREALHKFNALRVLCAVREGEQGLYALNRTIERILHDKRLINAGSEFYENRPMILTRNYYEHGLFNGDVGIVRADEKGTLMIWFEDSAGELRAVLPSYLSQAETVFAMTIHKSQGSEFDEVLVVLPASADARILTRELLYTAVTRARRRVCIQGTPDVILAAASCHVERASGIASRFHHL